MSRRRIAEGMQRTSGSTSRKILRAIARGWRPGAGPVGEFVRRPRRWSPAGIANSAEGDVQ
jgi:hypothetical protein